MKRVKLISDGTWFDEGTEVYQYDKSPLERMTLEEYSMWKKEGFILVCGYRNGEIDGESCCLDEFSVEEVDS